MEGLDLVLRLVAEDDLAATAVVSFVGGGDRRLAGGDVPLKGMSLPAQRLAPVGVGLTCEVVESSSSDSLLRVRQASADAAPAAGWPECRGHDAKGGKVVVQLRPHE